MRMHRRVRQHPRCYTGLFHAGSCVAQRGSACLITRRSQVQILPPLPRKALETGPFHFLIHGAAAETFAQLLPNPPAIPMPDRAEHLTAAQKGELETELAELEGPRRADVVEAIKTARGFGDLSENFEYHAAKNEQGLLERRIAILRDRLRRAVLIDEEAAAASDKVSVGSRVAIDRDEGETMDVEISSDDGVSPESPLGKALIGRGVGDEVVVEAPKGTWRARITGVSRS
jgi:transcription elongation factor GreA